MEFDFQFASVSFRAGSSSNDHFGSNGLPVTPNSIGIIGNYKSFADPVTHDNLVKYVDGFRAKHEKVTLIFEHWPNAVNPDVNTIINHCLKALHNLHYENGCIHGLITPHSIVFDGHNYKLSNWPLNLITENGRLLDSCSFLPSDIRFIAPERVLNLNNILSKKSDVWSLALSMLTLVCPEIQIPQNPSEYALCKTVDEVFDKLRNLDIPENCESFFRKALHPNLSERFNVKQLMSLTNLTLPLYATSYTDSLIRFDKLDIENGKKRKLSCDEAYYLWSISSSAIKENDEDNKSIAIKNIPTLVILESVQNNQTNKWCPSNKLAFVPEIKILQVETLKERLRSIPRATFYPLIFSTSSIKHEGEDICENAASTKELPLLIRENDVEYQCERMLLFKRLVDAHPFARETLLEVAKNDISPHHRATAWAAILNVKWSHLISYEQMDKMTPTSTDRQISVDIPRCHQYNDLLASPQGHNKLKRILKAWLNLNEPNYVYWQGLDSLAAPFVTLNFHNEAMAFACFNQFIHKYLRGFFSKDNSSTIQEYLALFEHLITFHDPTLSNHLRNLNFTPELYAIPWFLTMFTHVLPLHKIVHIWDTLLLGTESFPLFIGMAILMQLRNQLLGFTFNDCILIFSDLPEINIERCVRDAKRLCECTPHTVVKRGLIPVHEIREETSPRIDMDELLSQLKYLSSNKLVLIDGRSDEEKFKYGEMLSSLNPESIPSIKELNVSGKQLVVVVNNLPFVSKLIENDVSRVCSLFHRDFLPPQLML